MSGARVVAARFFGYPIGKGDSLNGKHTMRMRTIVLSATLVFGFATAASAGIAPAPLTQTGDLIINVAEGCGPGRWRGPRGRCHPMPQGRACPRGYHLGPHGRRCWPN